MANGTNDFKIGYNAAAKSTENGVAPTPLMSGIIINLSGPWPTAASRSVELDRPGASGRSCGVNSAGNGAAAPYKPYSLAFDDNDEPCHGHALLQGGRNVRIGVC